MAANDGTDAVRQLTASYENWHSTLIDPSTFATSYGIFARCPHKMGVKCIV